MPANIIIGADAQPATSGDIVIGTTPSGAGGALIEFEVPRVAKGVVMLAIIVRDGPIIAPAGWDLVVDGIGGAGVFLDVFARMADESDLRFVDQPAKTVAFLSLTEQELQGQLFVFERSSPATVIEAHDHVAFAASATPVAPAPATQHATNLQVCIWSAVGNVALTAPPGFTVIDAYTSAEFVERSILLAYKIAKVTGALDVVSAAAAPAASGRAFTLVLRHAPPVKPRDLFDPVPGQIGLRR